MNKKMLFGLAATAILLIVGFFGYSYWTGTPTYSLSQIPTAIETHDVELFNKHVDIATLSGRLIDDMMAQATSQIDTQGTNAWSALGAELGKGLVKLMKPRLAEMFKEEIEKYIETGDFGKSEEELTEASVTLPGLQNKFGRTFTDIKYTKEEGKIALVGVGLFNDRLQSHHTLELKMRQKEGGYWQLVEFANIPALMKEIQTIEQAKLDEINRPTKEKMDLALSPEKIRKKSFASDSWGINRKVSISISLKNQSDFAVKSFVAEMRFLDPQDKLIKSYNLSSEKRIPAKSTQQAYWEFNVNQFLSDESRLYETPESELKYEFIPLEMTLADGSELKIKKTLE